MHIYRQISRWNPGGLRNNWLVITKSCLCIVCFSTADTNITLLDYLRRNYCSLWATLDYFVTTILLTLILTPFGMTYPPRTASWSRILTIPIAGGKILKLEVLVNLSLKEGSYISKYITNRQKREIQIWKLKQRGIFFYRNGLHIHILIESWNAVLCTIPISMKLW